MNSEAKERDGVKAIIALQALAGIVETPEQAKAGWAKMSPSEQQKTLRVYAMIQFGKATGRPLPFGS